MYESYLKHYKPDEKEHTTEQNEKELIKQYLNNNQNVEKLINYTKNLVKKIGPKDRNDEIHLDIFQTAVKNVLQRNTSGEVFEDNEAILRYMRRVIRNCLFDEIRRWKSQERGKDTERAENLGDGPTYLAEHFDNLSPEAVLAVEPGFPIEEGIPIDTQIDVARIRKFLEEKYDMKKDNKERNLKIFDLVTIEGLKFSEIAKIIFEDDTHYDFGKQRDINKAGDRIRKIYDRMIVSIKEKFPDIK